MPSKLEREIEEILSRLEARQRSLPYRIFDNISLLPRLHPSTVGLAFLAIALIVIAQIGVDNRWLSESLMAVGLTLLTATAGLALFFYALVLCLQWDRYLFGKRGRG